MAAAGCDALVAGGGDGTVGTVAAVARAHGLPLGVLPLGTLNHFAKDLGMPPALDDAAAVIAETAPRAVDAAEANGELFLNNASLGVYPRLVRLRERHRARGTGKWLAALWATLAVLRRHPFFDVALRTAEQATRRRTPFVMIANNAYRMAGLQPQTRERLDAGELAVYTYQATQRSSLLALGLRVVLFGVDRVRELEVQTTPEVTVATPRQAPRLALDGELTDLRPPLVARILPRALLVLAPPPTIETTTET
jgi:diacylglycerol kinase family enzyme